MAGEPVELRVAAILRAMSPDLPIACEHDAGAGVGAGGTDGEGVVEGLTEVGVETRRKAGGEHRPRCE